MKKLLAITAIIEGATGLGLLAAPATLAQLLLGGTLDTPAALTVARVGGAALLAISVACWLNRENGRAFALSGLGLWPAIALHLAFAFWCMACLRSKRVGMATQISRQR